VEDWEARRLDATVQAAALCAYVDGHLACEERERLCECIATHAESEEEARRLLTFARELPEWIRTPRSGFRDSQIAEIKQALRNQEERRHAFELAVRVAHAHRGIDVHETGFLLTLMFELGIDGNYARTLIAKVKAESRI
jgi:tellurite resistance protein